MNPAPVNRVRASLPALLCAALVVICTLAAWPFAETGLDDDYSYIFSARALAQTGHVHYVGWASAMVGWQLALGAAFIRLFGFSFSVTRCSVLLIAAATAFVLHRLLVRCGLSARNAVLVTLTVMLSPMALPLAFSFMTDMAGLFCTMLTAYCCVRALQAAATRGATQWLIAAMLISAVGGTARQTVWLCLIVMVPSTAWLLRRRKLSVVPLVLTWILSGMFAYTSLRWFYRQPYSVQETALQGYMDRDLLLQTAASIVRALLQCCLLALPVFVAFVPRTPWRNRKVMLYAASAPVLCFLLLPVALHRQPLRQWLLPFPAGGNFFSAAGVVDLPEIGVRPPAVPVWVQLVITLTTIITTIALLAFLLIRQRSSSVDAAPPGDKLLAVPSTSTVPTMRQLLWLTVPFTLAYLALVLHRALFAFPYDRYFITLLPFGLLLVARMYQQSVAPELPHICFVALAILASWGIAALHDTYADRRATVRAAQRLIDAGIPRTAFYAGFEYDGWTQVQQMGWMNVIAMRWPDGFHMDRPIPRHMTAKPCRQQFAHLDPAIQPRYGISFDQQACDGPSEFAPEVYHTWLPPFTRQLYIRTVTTPAF